MNRIAYSLMLAGAAALAAPAMAMPLQGVSPMPPAGPSVLELTAQGTALRTPDIAVIQAGVITENASAAAALSENSARTAAMLAALKRLGIAERDIQTAQVGLQPQYRYVEGQAPAITGYQASNQLNLRLRNLARAGQVLETLVAQGANSIQGPTLTVEALDAALDDARADAVAKARARAARYALAAGMQLGRILSITEVNEGPRPPMPMAMARMDAAGGGVPIAAGEQALSISVVVRFELR